MCRQKYKHNFSAFQDECPAEKFYLIAQCPCKTKNAAQNTPVLWHKHPSASSGIFSGKNASASVAQREKGMVSTHPRGHQDKGLVFIRDRSRKPCSSRWREGRRHQVSWWHFPPMGTTHHWPCQPLSRKSHWHPGAAGIHSHVGGCHIMQASSPGKNNSSVTNGESQEMLLLCRSRCQRTAEQGAVVYF